ncbi:MAG: zinc ABC transporter solute-binding protein [Candidatus Aminicenantes bacterium]|nr:zinc ABC transporter solute-binding protein [Candidatus Aminicenantes bacterium]
MIRGDFRLTKQSILGKKIFLFFLRFFLILVIFGFQAQDLDAAKKIRVVTSVFPLLEFAGAVSGERGEVSLLLPPGAEIHTWQPRPSDIIRLSSADLFIYVGADLEPWLHDLLKSVRNPNLKVLEASLGIPLIDEEGIVHNAHEHEHGAHDPHIWLDFKNDQRIVDKIAAVLSEMDPEGSLVFKRNAFIYKEKLQMLDQKFKDGLMDCVHRTIILGGHAAFGYLARSYNLRQISLYGLSPDSSPTPKKLIKVVELAKKYRIKVIFFEIRVRDELAKVLAEEVGARTLVLNPGANLTKEQLKSGKTFFDIMEANLENLKDGLDCK